MKSSKRRAGGKTGAIVALCVVLVLTIALGVIGLTGMSIPPRGLYKIQSWLPTWRSANWPASLPLGLDLRGGMYVEYSGKAPEGSTANFDELVEGTMSIIRTRLSDKGFNEANVQRIGTDGIRVEIPDVQDDTVLDLIGAAAKLEFKNPSGETFMTGDMVRTATYYYSDGDHQIAFTLTDEGSKLFADVTAANIGKTIAIYLDGEQLIAPTVQSAITNGSGVINGLGSAERATTIAAKIQSGALPLELTQQKVDKVSATLGQDAVSTSVKAAVIGIFLIMVLMIVRYRLNGLIASWALTIYTILLFMLIALFHIQLTLPGLAGVVLGIGMAVDANVIIFERFNEANVQRIGTDGIRVEIPDQERNVRYPGRQRDDPDRRRRAADLRHRFHPGLCEDPAAGRGRFHVHRDHGHPLPDEPLRQCRRHQHCALYPSES